jgi:isopenicillin N synthase-like dioxygenase
MPNEAAPIVDLSAFESGSADVRMRIGAEVDRICRHTGFITLAGHGVDEAVRSHMWDAVRRFFDLPGDVKRRFATADGLPYGYMGNEAEALAASRGDATPADIKETFNAGPLRIPDHVRDPEALAFCYSATPWPDTPSDFVSAWSAYYVAMESLAARIMRMFAVALGLPDDHFDPFLTSPISALRALNYPPQDRAPLAGQLRAGAHSDYGTLTILWPQDDSRGLEILDPSGEWHEVLPTPGTFVINIGDLMARWTNDRWRSTLHRVVNPDEAHDPGSRRQSIAYFHQPDWSATIAALPGLHADDTSYEPVRSGPYLMGKFTSTVR